MVKCLSFLSAVVSDEVETIHSLARFLSRMVVAEEAGEALTEEAVQEVEDLARTFGGMEVEGAEERLVRGVEEMEL